MPFDHPTKTIGDGTKPGLWTGIWTEKWTQLWTQDRLETGEPLHEYLKTSWLYTTGTCGCFELAVCLSPRCKRKQNDVSTIDSRGTALITQAQHREAAPEARKWQETGV